MSSDPPHASRRTVTEVKTSTASGPTTSTTGTRRRSYSNHLGNVDARLKRLTNDVFPESPYYLTVPTDRPFNLGDRYVSNWAVGTNTVFAPEEEHLQYMTFLAHHNDDTLLIPVGGWADAKGNIMPEEEEPVRPPSASQDGEQKKKKKITFSDYKKAQQGGVPKQEGGEPSAAKNEAASLKKEPAEQPKQQHDTDKPKELESSSKPNGGALETTAGKGKNHVEKPNRTAEQQATTTNSDKTVTPPKRKVPHEEAAPSPKKKLRLSTEQLPESDKPSEKSKKDNPSVPELLSPTLPPNIPTLLSPTLPGALEDELVSVSEKPRSSTESHTTKTTKKPASSGSSLASTTEKPEPSKLKATESGRPHSASTSSASSKSTSVKPGSGSGSGSLDAATASTAKSNDHKPATSPAQSAPGQPTSTRPKSPAPAPAPAPASASAASSSSHPSHTKPSARPGPPSKRRLMVKLKYGRQNRKRVEALLKFASKKQMSTESSSLKKQKAGASPMPQHPSEKPSSGTKRSKEPDADDSLEPVAKRQRSSTGTSDRPHTPSIQVTKPSPTTTTSNKQFPTPSTGVKGVAMRRVSSGDSQTSTPGKTSSQGSGSSTADKSKKPPPPTSAAADGQAAKPSETDHQRVWRDEFRKFTSMGRDLKHTASRYIKDKDKEKDTTSSSSSSNGTADAKLAAATGVEAILCFILAFLADDQFKSLSRQQPDSTNWRSIIAYWHAVARGAAPYPHLHALSFFLGAVSHEAIHSLDLERLAVSAAPSEHDPAATSGSDGNTVTPEESKKYKREFTDLKTRLPESYREANRLWLAGARQLPDDILARQYPGTWSRRSKNFSSRGSEKMKVGKYAGEYFLPLGRGGAPTTPLEAVRFGLSFLEEWCETEGVKWKGRLVL